MNKQYKTIIITKTLQNYVQKIFNNTCMYDHTTNGICQ